MIRKNLKIILLSTIIVLSAVSQVNAGSAALNDSIKNPPPIYTKSWDRKRIPLKEAIRKGYVNPNELDARTANDAMYPDEKGEVKYNSEPKDPNDLTYKPDYSDSNIPKWQQNNYSDNNSSESTENERQFNNTNSDPALNQLNNEKTNAKDNFESAKNSEEVVGTNKNDSISTSKFILVGVLILLVGLFGVFAIIRTKKKEEYSEWEKVNTKDRNYNEVYTIPEEDYAQDYESYINDPKRHRYQMGEEEEYNGDEILKNVEDRVNNNSEDQNYY